MFRRLACLAFLASYTLILPGTHASHQPEDHVQAVLNAEDAPHLAMESRPIGIMDELADLLQASIWVDENKTDVSEVATSCCTVLNDALPGLVFFPHSSEYALQQATYHSLAQSDLLPRCRVTPTSAPEVSAIVTLAANYECHFAVRSGGHMVAAGSSNINGTGFTIDLGRMNTVSLASEAGLVSFGAGSRWGEVYEALAPFNLTTAGSRLPSDGVGGFLLGGGLSALSPEHGFGSSSVVNYQVVIANGSILDVNAETHPDLFWALKYGSTNFGVVTRFDMKTFPLEQVWGGIMVYELNKAEAMFEVLTNVTAKLDQDPAGSIAIGLVYEPVQDGYVVWSPTVYLSPVSVPSLYSDLEGQMQESLFSTMRVDSWGSVMDEWESMSPGSSRVHWFTLTVKPDGKFLLDMHLRGAALFDGYRRRSGFTWGAISQPLNRRFAEASQKSGGHPSGINPADGDLIVVYCMVRWSDSADEELFLRLSDELQQWAESTAQEHKLLHPFIYMNYAAESQAVMAGLGTESLHRMRMIRDLYDPSNTLGSLWKGGFKLS